MGLLKQKFASGINLRFIFDALDICHDCDDLQVNLGELRESAGKLILSSILQAEMKLLLKNGFLSVHLSVLANKC